MVHRPALVTAAHLVALSFLAMPADAQVSPAVARLEATPSSATVVRGESVSVLISAFSSTGQSLSPEVRVVGARGALQVERDEGNAWTVTGLRVGEHRVTVTSVPADPGVQPVILQVPLSVAWPPVDRIDIASEAGGAYVGTRLAHEATVIHTDGSSRPGAQVRWRSSEPAVATVDNFGNVRALAPGSVTITADFEGVEGRLEHRVAAFPGASIELTGGAESIRTGDVLTFAATVRNASGESLPEVPVTWSHMYTPDDSIVAPSGPGQLDGGRFVADWPGVYTILASAGPLQEETSFRVVKRDVILETEVVGQGQEQRVFTTDLWIFEGVDGRDYALTGSKNGNGVAFVWDVTNPANIFKTDSIVVDARTVNDVKVSPDGRYGVLSREGASTRRNGVVILDLSDPAHPVVASEYDETVTGGVHNMFATDTHLFTLSAGDKYVILDMSDIYRPRMVSEYDHPGSRVHDVWVHDGLAYSAEWENGVVVVDVGNGRWGGSPENPVFVTNFPLPSGRTHAVFPYFQESSGRFYLIVGDEIVNRNGLAWEGTGPDHRQQYDPVTGTGGYPRATSGYIQIVDFTDPMAPEMVARYEVTEYGTHNMWVEDDILYQAYYEGGVRMVDLSGDLMGNLYTQNREIAVFKAHDPVGYIPNSPGAWGVQPHKGQIFFADINSGLWAVKLQPRGRPIS